MSRAPNIRKEICNPGVGLSRHPLYSIWGNMIDRCHYPKRPEYRNYGGRGIYVCDRWRLGENGRGGLACFITDMGERPSGYTIERLDNDEGYSPENCVWAGRLAQSRNKRNNRKFFGMTMAELADRHGIRRLTLARRLNAGVPIDRALVEPVQKHALVARREFSDDDLRCIRAEPNVYGSGRMLARVFGVSPGIISRIRLGHHYAS